MSGRFRRIGALGAAVCAAVALGVPASATAAHAAALDFTLYAKEVPTDQSAPGADGRAPKLGDTFVFADDLSRTKGGPVVGRDGVSCTVVRTGDPGELLCTGAFVLDGGPGGQLIGQTMMAGSPSESPEAAFDIAVTGGTGDFKDARGYIRATPDGDYQRMEFHLTG
ncbi:dirigent protein [Streptomyces sp. NPDC089919]|uniref:dirigent protein n=1 Tax=Streptomyces sp. NPDC089919 TaxID=3155188 RepID=UPI003443F912